MADLLHIIDRQGQLARRIQIAIDRDLAGFELSKSQRHVVRTLAQMPESTHADIAWYTGMAGPQVSRTVKELVNAGLVSAEQSASHKRQRLLSLSEAGRAVFERLSPKVNAALDRALGSLDPDERALVLAGLNAGPEAVAANTGDVFFREVTGEEILWWLRCTHQQTTGKIASILEEETRRGRARSEAPISPQELAERARERGLYNLEKQLQLAAGFVNQGSGPAGKGLYAVVNDQIVGICLIEFGLDPLTSLAHGDELTAWIAALYVAPEFRQRGIGAALLRKSLKRFPHAPSAYSIWVRADDEALLALVRKFHFKGSRASKFTYTLGKKVEWKPFSLPQKLQS